CRSGPAAGRVRGTAAPRVLLVLRPAAPGRERVPIGVSSTLPACTRG
ncbi:MAG: hypothetical protein AVDCRST_MAG48-165, partial [uncultured Friedmanniella sp.]